MGAEIQAGLHLVYKDSMHALELWNNDQGLEAGEAIYAQLQPQERPVWAAGILRVVLDVVPGLPEAEAVVSATLTPDSWPRARELFHAVRSVTLTTTDRLQLSGLLLAENVAKVVYNASRLPEPGPFDQDAGPWVVACARTVTRHVDDPHFTDRVWRAIMRVQ